VQKMSRSIASNDDLTMVIPAYNSARYVDCALEVALACRPARVLFGDDASSDRTYHAAAKFQEKHPGVITVLGSKTNRGPTANWRYLCQMVKTRFFIKYDVDDIVHPSYVDAALQFLRENEDVVVCFANAKEVGADTCVNPDLRSSYLNHRLQFDDPEILEGESLRSFLARWSPYPYSLTTMFRTESYLAAGEFDGSIRYCGDMEILFRMACQGRMAYWREEAGLYRVVPSGIVQTSMRLRTAARDLLRSYSVARRLWGATQAGPIIDKKMRRLLLSCLRGAMAATWREPKAVSREARALLEDFRLYRAGMTQKQT
jgi:glycosyltransferase involved in cell wall biosynthesis